MTLYVNILGERKGVNPDKLFPIPLSLSHSQLCVWLPNIWLLFEGLFLEPLASKDFASSQASCLGVQQKEACISKSSHLKGLTARGALAVSIR